MKQHTSIENTPMRLHKFFTYVFVPISFVLMLVNLVTTISYWMEDYNPVFLLDITFTAGAVILLGVIFHHLMEYNKYTVSFIFGYYALVFIYILICIIVYSIYVPSGLAELVGRLIGQTIYAAIFCTYYYKRIPIFEAKAAQQAMETTIATDEDGTIIIEQPEPKQKYKTKKKLKILTGCLCAALAVSVGFNIYQANNASQIGELRFDYMQLESDYKTLNNEYNKLNSDYAALKNKQETNTVSQKDYNALKEKNSQLEKELATIKNNQKTESQSSSYFSYATGPMLAYQNYLVPASDTVIYKNGDTIICYINPQYLAKKYNLNIIVSKYNGNSYVNFTSSGEGREIDGIGEPST